MCVCYVILVVLCLQKIVIEVIFRYLVGMVEKGGGMYELEVRLLEYVMLIAKVSVLCGVMILLAVGIFSGGRRMYYGVLVGIVVGVMPPDVIVHMSMISVFVGVKEFVELLKEVRG